MLVTFAYMNITSEKENRRLKLLIKYLPPQTEQGVGSLLCLVVHIIYLKEIKLESSLP